MASRINIAIQSTSVREDDEFLMKLLMWNGSTGSREHVFLKSHGLCAQKQVTLLLRFKEAKLSWPQHIKRDRQPDYVTAALRRERVRKSY